MKKSDYRSKNATMVNYYNRITNQLKQFKFKDLDILRTETFLFINNEVENFLIVVTLSHKALNEDIEKFFSVIEKEILPEYMKEFYNVNSFKVKLIDESGQTEEINRIFINEYKQIDEKSEEEEEEI